jgi:small subunit ribosomal protein S13
MARIEGVELPRNKRIEVGLTYIFGIGPTRAREVLAATSINPDTRGKDLTEGEATSLREYISKNWKVEGDLRRYEQLNIKRLIEIGCYRGLRLVVVYQFEASVLVQTLASVKEPRRRLQVVVDVVAARNKPARISIR